MPRGRTRWMWTAAIICLYLLAFLAIERALGETSNAPVALLAFTLAWMWGRTVGLIAGLAGSLVNFASGRALGLELDFSSSFVFDTIAIMVVAFFIGHVAQALAGALGARYEADQAYTELEQTARPHRRGERGSHEDPGF